jgi:hypothetical protein
MELHVALCAAVANARRLEYIPQIDSLTTEPMRIEGGFEIPSSAPQPPLAHNWKSVDFGM